MLGYFKKDLSKDEKQEMLAIIEYHRKGYVPLVVPLTLFSHLVRKYDQVMWDVGEKFPNFRSISVALYVICHAAVHVPSAFTY